ncbi:MAG: FtsX-like permease family protein, partial [Spirochaetia bacterium]|nr:FtsX-like permease family protein [Spirochaetia bacterium]
SPGSLAGGGIFLNARLAENIETELGRPLATGEPVTLSMYSDGSFHIRKGIFSGIHSYISYTEPLDRIVLADASIVRSLANYTTGYVSGNQDEDSIPDSGSFDMDDLFSGAEDNESSGGEGITLVELEQMLSDTTQRTALVETDAAAWSFILLSAGDRGQGRLLRVLENEAEENQWAVRILNWRNAAGLGAQAVFALQTVFYSGMIFIVFGAVLVIMNALVISVFERIPEIGTMRGLGAGRRFISSLFIAESMILTMSASIAGIILGIIISYVTLETGITIENELLITLFGGNVIRPVVSVSGIVKHLVMALAAGSIAWIYPVSLAMRIQPVEVMGKG